MLSIVTRNAEETRKLGKMLGEVLLPSSIVALIGGLGSGKTTLVQGIAQGLGTVSSVRSPSYLIIHEYDGPIPLYHLDLYRIRSKEEIISLGYEEYLYQKRGVVVIEWADRMKDLLKTSYLKVSLEMIDLLQRRVTFQPQGTPYEEIVEKIKKITS